MDPNAKQALSMSRSGLSVEYIAKFLCETTERIQALLDGELDCLDPNNVPRPKAQLVPVSRPFPDLTDDMTDRDRIVVLTKHGLSARKILRYLQSTSDERTVSRYAAKILGPPRRGNSSSAHWISPTFMPYIEYCLEQLGKDKYTCELCLDPVPRGCVIHHTKYIGATIYDLMYICQSCNLARENKGLT